MISSKETLIQDLTTIISEIEQWPENFNISLSKIFATPFCEIPYDPNTLILEANLILTNERRNLIKNILERIMVSCQTGLRVKILLNGPQGIGKTWSLWLLGHILKLPKFSQHFRILYISKASDIEFDGWRFILKEFLFGFPESISLNEEMPRSKCAEALEQEIFKYNKQGKFTVLICDQINELKSGSLEIFNTLRQMPWNFIMCSQSANNDDSSKDLNMDNFVKIERISLFLPQEIDFFLVSQHFQISKDEWRKVQEVAGSNPREIALLLSQKAKNINDKIERYKYQRGTDIWKAHSDYIKTLSPSETFLLSKGVFYMDKDLILDYALIPIIDKKWMILKKSPFEKDFKISSLFPFSRKILLDFLYATLTTQSLEPENFYKNHLDNLRKYITSPTTNPGVRGNFYEEYILTRFEKSVYSPEQFKIMIQPSIYLNGSNYSLKKHGWEVKNFNIFFIFSLLFFFRD